MNQQDANSPERHSEQAAAARALLLAGNKAMLSTHSVDVPGYPFGSVAPYCTDGQGRPVILISALAQHSKNLRADHRASLLVSAGGDDLQASARLTVLGDFSPVPEADVEMLAARYYRFFPQSRDHHKALDFSFWALNPVRLRFIAGFARIHWLSPDHLLHPNPFYGEAEAGIVAHMNADHADALRLYAQAAGIPLAAEETPEMAGIDAEGLHLRSGERLARIPFASPVTTPGAAREVLVRLAREAREAAT